MATRTVAELLIQTLSESGVKTFYGVQGGACAHLIQAAAQTPESRFVPVLSEQSAGLFAHGHFLASRQVAGVIVTTGPGFFNALTGIAACYYDRVPLVILCGQVNAKGNLAASLGTRMYGFQEAAHADIAAHIAEYSVRVSDAPSLSRALSLIRSANQIAGPIFIEVLDDLQRLESTSVLPDFSPVSMRDAKTGTSEVADVSGCTSLLRSSSRPLFLAGAGVNAEAFAHMNRTSHSLGIPILFTWGAQHLIDPKNALHQGIFGNHAPGRGNALLRESDLLVAVGLGLLQHQVGKSHAAFAPKARIFYVNLEHSECSRARFDFGNRCTPLHAEAHSFLRTLDKDHGIAKASYWQGSTFAPLANQSIALPHVHEAVEALVHSLRGTPADAKIFSDAGATLSWGYQAANLTSCPPMFTSFNLHTMGYSLPAAIGANIATGGMAVSVSGDGGIMMNCQEFAHAVGRNIKILIIDNDGYGIIRQTQDSFLGSRYFGSAMDNEASPLPRYDCAKIIEGFGIPARRCDGGKDKAEMKSGIEWLFQDASAKALIIKVDPRLHVLGVGI